MPLIPEHGPIPPLRGTPPFTLTRQPLAHIPPLPKACPDPFDQ